MISRGLDRYKRILGLLPRDETAMLVHKHLKMAPQVLHQNRVKFPKTFYCIVMYTNMAAVTSDENPQ